MNSLLEAVAITVLCIVLLGCIGKMIDIAYNVAEASAVTTWRWVKRQARISILRGDIHGYDVDMGYLFKSDPFDARAYCVAAARRRAAAYELAELLAEKQKQPQGEEA